MKLTHENYHSKRANKKYMSNSQYKDFAGCLGMRGCEEMACAKLKGDWHQETTTAMLVGSYVDAHFSGTLDVFVAKHSIYRKNGADMLSAFRKADQLIERIEDDDYFMQTLSGETQVIMTAEMFGCDWKIAIDSFHEGKAIVDLKTCANIRKTSWVRDTGHVDFIRYWGYDFQMAIYQKVVEIVTGKKVPCLISAISKEKEPDIEVIGFDQDHLDGCLSMVETNMPRIIALREEQEEPIRCGKCDYCKSTKVLTGAIHLSELEVDFT